MGWRVVPENGKSSLTQRRQDSQEQPKASSFKTLLFAVLASLREAPLAVKAR
jgi:hypothetical protein